MASSVPGDAPSSITQPLSSTAQSLSNEQISTVEAPRMAANTFPTWDAFSTYFSAYQRQTFQVYTSKSSTSVATRNQRIRGSAVASSSGAKLSSAPVARDTSAGKLTLNQDQVLTISGSADNSGRTLNLVPTEVRFYAKTLICTHGGKPRSRSQGIRPRQRFRSKECPAKLNLVAQKKLGQDGSKADNWQVVVTQHVTTHNHSLDAKTYMAYPQNRRVDDPEVLETVNTLRKAGVKQSKIRAYLKEKTPSKPVTKSDVHNLLTKLKDDGSFTAKLRTTSQSSPSTAISATGHDDTTLQDTVMMTTTTQAQLDAAAARRQELKAQDARLLHHVGGSIDSGVSSPGFDAETATLTSVSNAGVEMQNTGNPLANLSDVGEKASGTFKLRVSRLEQQNLSLFAQNTKLCEQNKQLLVELCEARKKASEYEGRLMALQKSESILTAAVNELSRKMESVAAENVRWKHQIQQLAASTFPSVGGEGTPRINDGLNYGETSSLRLGARGGLQAVLQASAGGEEAPGDRVDHREHLDQAPKRPLFNGTISEMEPPAKRVSSEVEINADARGQGQQHVRGLTFSS